MIYLARALLAPILLVQARRLFAGMVPLPEAAGVRRGLRGPVERRAAEACVPNVREPLRLLIVGDSSAAGVGVAHQDDALLGRVLSRLEPTREVSFALVAKHGSTLEGTLRHLRKLPAEAFDVAVVSLGANDLTRGIRRGPWLATYRELVGELRSRFGVRHLVLSGLPPLAEFPALPQPLRWVLGRQARQFDHALERWAADEPGLSYAGLRIEESVALFGESTAMASLFAADGFHPGPRVYDVWAARAVERIEAIPWLAAPCWVD